jgi:hypothetical protein
MVNRTKKKYLFLSTKKDEFNVNITAKSSSILDRKFYDFIEENKFSKKLNKPNKFSKKLKKIGKLNRFGKLSNKPKMTPKMYKEAMTCMWMICYITCYIIEKFTIEN